METPVKTSNTDTAIKVIGAVFGTAHLIFQTAADLTSEAEGRLVEKVSKGAITKQETIINRKQTTELKQLKMLEAVKKMQQRTKSTNQLTPSTNEN